MQPNFKNLPYSFNPPQETTYGKIQLVARLGHELRLKNNKKSENYKRYRIQSENVKQSKCQDKRITKRNPQTEL